MAFVLKFMAYTKLCGRAARETVISAITEEHLCKGQDTQKVSPNDPVGWSGLVFGVENKQFLPQIPAGS